MHRKPLAYLALLVGAVLGAFLSHLAPPADASRNSSGTYSLPAGQPVVSGTTISSTVHNALASDIATELTSSLDRSGRGAMLAPLQLSNGTNAAPSLTFATDQDTGLYRVGANDVALTAGGVKGLECTATACTATLPMVCSGTFAVTGTSAFTGVLSTTHGILATQATADQAAIGAVGNGSGSGVSSTGGATGAGATLIGGGTSGAGVVATAAAGNSDGATLTGSGTRPGVYAIGGTTGSGGDFSAGGSTTANTNTRFAVVATAGHVKLAGGNPSATTAFSNALTPSSAVKAWGHAETDGSGGVSLSAGFNLTSVTCGGSGNDDLIVTMASAMSGTSNYAVLPTITLTTAAPYASHASATVFGIRGGSCDGSANGATPLGYDFVVVGLQ